MKMQKSIIFVKKINKYIYIYICIYIYIYIYICKIKNTVKLEIIVIIQGNIAYSYYKIHSLSKYYYRFV